MRCWFAMRVDYAETHVEQVRELVLNVGRMIARPGPILETGSASSVLTPRAIPRHDAADNNQDEPLPSWGQLPKERADIAAA